MDRRILGRSVLLSHVDRWSFVRYCLSFTFLEPAENSPFEVTAKFCTM